jgi:magnesium transporter
MKDKVLEINKNSELILPKIKKDLTDYNLTELLFLKKRVSKIETRLREIKEAVKEILDDDDEFSDLVSISSNDKSDYEETESILENFIEQIDDYIGNMFAAKEDVQDTEEYMNLKLSSRRTTIVKIDLIATIITLGLSLLAVIVGLFGVNLKNHIEDSSMAFQYLYISLIILFLALVIGIFYYLKKKKVI